MAAPHFSEGRRRGVRAGRKILAGELIESAPVIVVSAEECKVLVDTDLAPYLERWPTASSEVALPLGYAPMYNDVADPNTRVVTHPDEMTLEIVATCDIDEGEEITLPRRETLAG